MIVEEKWGERIWSCLQVVRVACSVSGINARPVRVKYKTIDRKGVTGRVTQETNGPRPISAGPTAGFLPCKYVCHTLSLSLSLSLSSWRRVAPGRAFGII